LIPVFTAALKGSQMNCLKEEGKEVNGTKERKIKRKKSKKKNRRS
jgi:hypothetical protein